MAKHKIKKSDCPCTVVAVKGGKAKTVFKGQDWDLSELDDIIEYTKNAFPGAKVSIENKDGKVVLVV